MNASRDPVVLALGSNLGDRLSRLRAALSALVYAGLTIESASSIYETDAVGDVPAPSFLNAVLLARTSADPAQLLRLTQGIEREAGRRSSHRDAPRELDIDIIFFGDRVVSVPGLAIPHPSWQNRSFVLEPLLDVAPEWRDPKSGRTVMDIYQAGEWNRTQVTRVHPPSMLLSAFDAVSG